jgi:hypothetical protein
MDWNDLRVHDAVISFLQGAHLEGDSAAAENVTARLVSTGRVDTGGGESLRAFETPMSLHLNLTRIYEQRSNGPTPLLAGTWRFASGPIIVQVQLTKASIFGGGNFPVDADVGGDAAGPIVNQWPRSLDGAERETRSVFKAYGLPAPTFENVRWDSAHTCTWKEP